MGDPFGQLPAEIFLMIFKQVPSLPSLRNLILASSAASEMFDSCGVTIVESIISHLPEELKWNIRAAILMLYDYGHYYIKVSNPPTSLWGPYYRGSSRSSQYKYPRKFDFNSTFPKSEQLSLPQYLPSSHLRSVLRYACHIHQLAAIFLQDHINRLRSIVILHRGREEDLTSTEIVPRYPNERRFKSKVLADHSWIEEYRVIRVMWFMLLAHIRSAMTNSAKAKAGCKRERWRKADDDFLTPALIRDVMDFVECWMEKNSFSVNPQPNNQLPIPSHEADARSLLERPPVDKISHAWGQDFSASQNVSAAMQFYDLYDVVDQGWDFRRNDWEPLRALGCAIWDSKRMVMMGLLPVPREAIDSGVVVDLAWIKGDLSLKKIRIYREERAANKDLLIWVCHCSASQNESAPVVMYPYGTQTQSQSRRVSISKKCK